MTTGIIQEHPERGSRQFELVDDAIEYRISSPLGEEELTVVLSVLSPEPVVDGSMTVSYTHLTLPTILRV